MTSATQLHYSYAQYLEVLERSDFKLEYCDGAIYAMAGGTIAHAELSARVLSVLGEQLQSCRTFTSDLKVRVAATGLATFPDGSVVGGPLVRSAEDHNAVANPTLLVEVTSHSTEEYDRGDKLAHYQQLPSLRLVLFVSHREPRITAVRRTAGGWEATDHVDGDTVPLLEANQQLPVASVYAGIELDER